MVGTLDRVATCPDARVTDQDSGTNLKSKLLCIVYRQYSEHDTYPYLNIQRRPIKIANIQYRVKTAIYRNPW